MRLALVIGNSRLHWAVLSEAAIYTTWDIERLDSGAIAPLCAHPDPLNALLTLAPAQKLAQLQDLEAFTLTPPLIVVSVVPQQTAFWQRHISCDVITLEQIPLKGLYTTMGLDRAIAALGAGATGGFPVLVIDGGTALTLTGIDGDRRVIGGAILPGLRLQGRSLNQHTAALPEIDFAIPSSSQTSAIPRWAMTTPDAIRSGIFYTVLSGIRDFVEDWHGTHVNSRVVLTGGDGEFLYRHLGDRHPQMKPLMSFEPHLVFKGIQILLKKKCPER